jgi:hypothetical protein
MECDGSQLYVFICFLYKCYGLISSLGNQSGARCYSIIGSCPQLDVCGPIQLLVKLLPDFILGIQNTALSEE